MIYTGYASQKIIPGETFPEKIFWIKWVIKEDGTMDEYIAQLDRYRDSSTLLANDEDWGNPVTYHWSIKSARYVNTGERYYAIDRGEPSATWDRGGMIFQQLAVENLSGSKIIGPGGWSGDYIQYGSVQMKRGDANLPVKIHGDIKSYDPTRPK